MALHQTMCCLLIFLTANANQMASLLDKKTAVSSQIKFKNTRRYTISSNNSSLCSLYCYPSNNSSSSYYARDRLADRHVQLVKPFILLRNKKRVCKWVIQSEVLRQQTKYELRISFSLRSNRRSIVNLFKIMNLFIFDARIYNLARLGD